MTIHRRRRTWAGLRSFVADGELVGSFDPLAPGFSGVAALSGCGIQTSAACAAQLTGQPLPDAIAREGLDAHALRVRRA